VQAQIVIYSFGTSGSPTTNASSTASDVSASVFSGLNGTPATGSGSPVYSAGSGGSYFTATAWTGAAPGSNYFQFTITPDSGYSISTTTLTFGYRATPTGPTAYSIRSSADSYTANLASGSFTNDGNWSSVGSISITLSGLVSATTLRLYGSGASTAGGTLRVDDVGLSGTVTAIPESSTYAAILGTVTLLGVVIWRRRLQRAV
ncbi:MAG TPA: hypothetical protein PLQ52_10530, partial [Lacunisphaera sp.]|nr:hypothetical protein [Lacunisphaera sp.]